MAYQHSQLARECSAVLTPSARLVLMILASAMDKDRHTCFWRWQTLLHYSKLSRSTLASALNEIEGSGIITREHRFRQSNIYVWHPDVAEALRDPVRTEADKGEDFSSQEPRQEIEPSYGEDDIIELAQTFNSRMKLDPSLNGKRCNSELLVRFMEDKGISFLTLREVLLWSLDRADEGTLPNAPGTCRMSWLGFTKNYDILAEKYVESKSATVSRAFEIDEEI